MWDLEAPPWRPFYQFSYPQAFTYGERKSSERNIAYIRSQVVGRGDWPAVVPTQVVWGFRIELRKARPQAENHKKGFDLDNAAKAPVDAFCRGLIERHDPLRERPEWRPLALFEDDHIGQVGMLQLQGRWAPPSEGSETKVSIYYRPA
ncbi:MAG TPA: hypothetical protein VNZ52_03965 [Candidatus Thermoplasmatota archaeon]|nr:hypothetical protein [Candidatus Thermoplasmatota archaeon]